RHGAPETARSARAAAAAAREAAPAPAEGLPPQPDRLLAASAQPALPAGAALHGAGEAGEAAAAGPVTGLPTGAWPTAQPGGAHALPQGATIAAPLSSPQWGAEMSRQVVQLSQSADGRQQIAELRLDPPELGPLRITLSLQDGVAHAVFASSHAAVRQAVEAALPTLEQSLAQAGISLGQANVNDQQQPGQQGFAQAQSAPRTAGAASQDQEGATPVPRTAAADPRSLVDTFA
ncbi:flagellar hook-length control protein FliK, partial [Orrella sp. JC864]|uniref:flagellar hook-length control protein FliK n=1 Tax=Orrella sp. JC864 TaxID=3120298 RepID=UPI0030082538